MPKKKVLHYKTNYLNRSETFINRLVRNHVRYIPAAMCYRKRDFTNGLNLHTVPARGIAALKNTIAFHLNRPLPFYRETVEQVSPQVIHSHFGYDAHKLMRIADEAKIPHVVSFYGSDVSRLPDEPGWTRRYRELARRGSSFIAASGFMKAQLTNLGFPEEKISIVRFGLDPEAIRFRDEFRLKPDFMMVGRLVEKKGFEFGIRAVAQISKQTDKVSLNIYGDGPRMPDLRNLVRQLDIENLVHFHGFRPVEDIIDALMNHSVMIAPSITAADGDMEGLPNTILEALAAGTPIVTTRHAAIPEVVEGQVSGFLVDEKDSDGLAASILELLHMDNSRLESIRREGRRRIEEDYSVSRMVAQVEEIYDSVTG